METQEPKQPELKATTFCMVCGTPCRMEPVTDNLDGEGSVSYKYIPTTAHSKIIELLKKVRPYLNYDFSSFDLAIEIDQALKEAKAL